VIAVPLVFSVGAAQVNVADPVAFPAGALTAMANGPMDALLKPLLAIMVIFPAVPILLAVGMPLNAPVLESKPAHAGFCTIEKVTTSMLDDTIGWNKYLVPAVTLVGGFPFSISDAGDAEVVALLLVLSLPQHPPKTNAMTINAVIRGSVATCPIFCMRSFTSSQAGNLIARIGLSNVSAIGDVDVGECGRIKGLTDGEIHDASRIFAERIATESLPV
jgi:hypothetical protein